MKKASLNLLLAAGLAAALSFAPLAHAADPAAAPPPRDAAGPADGGPPDGAPPQDAPPPRPGGFHLLPPHAAEKLKFTADQRKELTDLEGEVRAKLDKILTSEQKQQLEQMRPPPPRRDAPGGPGAGDGPDSGADRPQRPPPPQDNDAAPDQQAPQQGAAPDQDPSHRAVTFTGGYETDPRDHGRPVVLVAAALDVTSDVFRKAFSNVKPASGGREPEPAQVRLNKQTLMQSLSPFGVTDERLNTVSNFYRYSSSRGQMWRNTPATAYATVKDGVVTGFTITNPGAGYSSPPKVSVAGMPDVAATAALSFSIDFKTNGSIKAITIAGKAP
jgi:hypothetical protein